MDTFWSNFSGRQYFGLAPWVWIEFESSEPPGPFPFLGGIAPRVAAGLHEVHQHLSGAIDIVIGDVFAGRARADDPLIRTRLEDAYAEVVRSRPRLRRMIRCGRSPDGAFYWEYPLDAGQSAPIRYSGLRLFNAATRQTVSVGLDQHPAHAVGRWIGCLDGTQTVGDLQAELRRLGMVFGPQLAAYLTRLTERLDSLGGLAPSSDSSIREQWLRATQDRDMVHLGHAALLYRQRDRFLLFDPWLIPWFAEAPVPSLWTTLLPKPAAIFLTHDHDDHVDPRTLLAFPKETPVIVPSRVNRRALFYDYRALLSGLGFTNIVELAHGDAWPFDGGAVVAVPFYGECACELGMPRNCYLIVDRGCNSLIHVDSGPTNAGDNVVQDGVIDELVRRHGPISTVYAQPGQLLELRAFAAYACLSPPGRWLEVGENCCVAPDYLSQLVASARARLLVAYANGGADWLPDHPVFVFSGRNRALRDLVTAHWWPLEALEEPLRAQGCHLHQSCALDVVRQEPDGSPAVWPAAAPAPDQLYRLDHGSPPVMRPHTTTCSAAQGPSC
ncbi:MAG: hypothetical protein AB1411_14810 [Nitrospirota bacterium]